jgi:archaellum component FlaF (FlaF/FlaG flagellin family)
MARRIAVAAIIIGVALTVIFVGVISNEPFIPMPNEEEIGISNVVYVSASNTALVTVENLGSRFSNVPHNVTFVEAFLNGTDVTSNWASSKGTFTISKGESTVIALIVPSIAKGEEYSVKLVTAMGTTCISSLRV